MDTPTVSAWVRGHRYTAAARELADRHYSRRSPGHPQFVGPGRPLVLVTRCGRAAWVALEGRDPSGALRWRCSLFRNEGAGLSSELIASATALTFGFWRERYGELPCVRFSTEVDPSKVRRKRDPGRCFRRAGWTVRGLSRGGHGRPQLLVLDAPGELERVPFVDGARRVGCACALGFARDLVDGYEPDEDMRLFLLPREGVR